PGNGRGARSAVGLKDVAVDGDLVLAQGRKVDDGTQAAADEALDLLGPPRLPAGGGFAPHAIIGGARQHAVFGGHPSAILTLEPRRQPVLNGRGAQDMGVAEADEAGAFGMFRYAPLKNYPAQFRRRPAGWPHNRSLALTFGKPFSSLRGAYAIGPEGS